MTNTKKTIKKTNAKRQSSKKVEPKKNNNVLITILGIIFLSLVAVLVFRLTYAYFKVNVKDNNPDTNDVVVKSANLKITYIDGDAWISSKTGSTISEDTIDEKIEPGDTITKIFSVESSVDTNDVAPFNIVLQELTNTLDMNIIYDKETKTATCPTDIENEEVTYELYKGSSQDDITTKISFGTIPCIEENGELDIITDYVEPTSTNYYKLIVKYENLSTDQSDNMDYGKFETLLNIVDTGENYTNENRPTTKTTN